MIIKAAANAVLDDCIQPFLTYDLNSYKLYCTHTVWVIIKGRKKKRRKKKEKEEKKKRRKISEELKKN